MASKKFDNLNALDWDDSALIEAYNKGMSLRVKDFEQGNSSGKRDGSKKDEWSVGDYCRAIYPADCLEYEARIVALSGNCCTVDFLGYNEEVEVAVDSLAESKGKKARKKQIKKAKNYCANYAEESISEDNSRSEFSNSHSPLHLKRKMNVVNNQGNRMVDNSVNYAAAETTFQSVFPTPAHCGGITSSTTIPPAPPMPLCSEYSQNTSLCAMLTSWYMAGYYTGLHQAQKGQCQQRCCLRTMQNCCHH